MPQPKRAPDPTPVEQPETVFPFLEEKRTEIRARIAELAPLVDEHRLLLAADKALSGEPNLGGRPRTTR